MSKRRWHKVPLFEVGEAIEGCKKTGKIFNGCVGVWLRRRYGDANLKHVMGRGWYKLVSKWPEIGG